ncbi:hypothetical protein [Streptomyces laculatispora]|uniref:hypothetical protein n=1 Tax=Streptomyces laculatispora TaxID=887464 RepID=UPI0035118403
MRALRAAELEISAPGAAKAGTLSPLCAGRGIDASEVIASATCPTTSPSSTGPAPATPWPTPTRAVPAAVPVHTVSNEEDGVAHIIERLLGCSAAPARTGAAAVRQCPGPCGEAAVDTRDRHATTRQPKPGTIGS